MMARLESIARILVAGSLAAGCRASVSNDDAPGRPAPPGQVWVTPRQAADAAIRVEPVAPHVLDTVRTTGTVMVDDLRSGHVFAPVTGTVVEVLAQLGQQVRKGDPLAVVESPEIG